MVFIWLILFVLLPLAYLFYIELKCYILKNFILRLPGPTTLPLLGNAHQMGKKSSEILSSQFRFWYRYGQRNMILRIGYVQYVFFTEPEDVEVILTSNEMIQKSQDYDLLKSWLGDGLLNSHGSKWHKRRKMITPAFHFKILQNFHEVMNTNSTKFIEIMKDFAKDEEIFDVQKFVSYLTLDVNCETAMGISINALGNNETKIVSAFQNICQIFFMRFYHPFKNNEFFYKFSSEYKEYQSILATLRNFTNDVIRKRMMERRQQGSDALNDASETQDGLYGNRKMAFLDTLLTATIDGRPLTLDEIYEEVSTFIFEGHDTTTSGISFALYVLSRHPDVQRQVFAEQKSIIGEQDIEREASFQEIAEMKYLDMVIKEVQRLYPSVPQIARRSDKEYNINGTTVPKDNTINLFLMSMGYNERSFPDPYRFKPERFNNDGDRKNSNAFLYVPFSAGPRNCVGQKFAMLEMKTVVSKVVRSFEILPPTDDLYSRNGYVQHYFGVSEKERAEILTNPSPYDPILAAALTLKSDNGVQIRLRKRQAKA